MEVRLEDQISGLIYSIRGLRVMLDSDLAVLYGVRTSELNKAVKRNLDRFPADFMFQLTNQELNNLIFQFGTSSSWGGTRKLPNVFTVQGVAMLSSVLRSKQAVLVNIQIMRAFVQMRSLLASNKELAAKVTELESRVGAQDHNIIALFEAIKQLMQPEPSQNNLIGFRTKK